MRGEVFWVDKKEISFTSRRKRDEVAGTTCLLSFKSLPGIAVPPNSF